MLNRANEIPMVVSVSDFISLNFCSYNNATQRHSPRIVLNTLFASGTTMMKEIP